LRSRPAHLPSLTQEALRASFPTQQAARASPISSLPHRTSGRARACGGRWWRQISLAGAAPSPATAGLDPAAAGRQRRSSASFPFFPTDYDRLRLPPFPTAVVPPRVVLEVLDPARRRWRCAPPRRRLPPLGHA
jgi:hypothetical protein